MPTERNKIIQNKYHNTNTNITTLSKEFGVSYQRIQQILKNNKIRKPVKAYLITNNKNSFFNKIPLKLRVA